MAHSERKNHQNILVITASGGGGHLQAAKAKILEVETKHPKSTIITKDLLKELSGRLMGKFMINLWNTAQRNGRVKVLECLASSIPIFDNLFWIPLFYNILKLLWKHDIDHIINTQPLGLSSVMAAIRIVNYFKKKTIYVDIVLTELPTDYVGHYLTPIKNLSTKSRNLITLLTTKPLLKNHLDDKSFWEDYAGLKKEKVHYDDFPLRPAFKKYQNLQEVKKPLTLQIQFGSDIEKRLIEKVSEKGLKKLVFSQHHFNILLSPDDYVITLMLGSQPTQEATMSYVKHFIEILKKTQSSQHYDLFVFCSQKHHEPISLQSRISDLVLSDSNYPQNLTIIPMSPQSDEVIAPLYFRSQTTITKSGGVTAMELMAVASGNIWIHQEPIPLDFRKVRLYKFLYSFAAKNGMPRWEYGNAKYLCEMKGAQIIKPEAVPQNSLSLFSCS